eukprot:9398409-Lingulodinium_polyedra.AAC.1
MGIPVGQFAFVYVWGVAAAWDWPAVWVARVHIRAAPRSWPPFMRSLSWPVLRVSAAAGRLGDSCPGRLPSRLR